jgi:putative acetyltransferase
VTASSPPPGALTLRRATPRDAAAFAELMADPEVYAGLMQLPHPHEDLWRKRLEENEAPARADHLHLVAERDGAIVGSAGLHPQPQLRRRHAAVLGISVARHAHRTGVGLALMQGLLDYADHWAQILRVELTVFADNAPAIALYRRCGFEPEGRLRGYALRHGVYEDALAMARWHPRPPARRDG